MNADDSVPFGCESMADSMEEALKAPKPRRTNDELDAVVAGIKADHAKGVEETLEDAPKEITEALLHRLYETRKKKKALEKREADIKTAILAAAKPGDMDSTMRYGSMTLKLKEKAGRRTTNWKGFYNWVEGQLGDVDTVMRGFEDQGKPTISIEVEELKAE